MSQAKESPKSRATGDADVIEQFETVLGRDDPAAQIAAALIALAKKHGNRQLRSYLLERSRQDLETFLSARSAKRRAANVRLWGLLRALSVDTDKRSMDYLRQTFDRRDEITRAHKSDGEIIIHEVAAQLVAYGSKPIVRSVAMEHATRDAPFLHVSLPAAVFSMKAKRVFDEYSPYIAAKPKRQLDRDRRETMERLLSRGAHGCWDSHDDDLRLERFATAPKLDPRWLGAAIDGHDLDHPRLGLVEDLARPGHGPLNAWLVKKFALLLKRQRDVYDVIRLMIEIDHPDAVDCFLRGAAVYLPEEHEVESYYKKKYLALLPDLPQAVAPLDDLIETFSPEMRLTVRRFRKQVFIKRIRASR